MYQYTSETNAASPIIGMTYQRLRQICNNDCEYDSYYLTCGGGVGGSTRVYCCLDQVPNFAPDTPGDRCDDQVGSFSCPLPTISNVDIEFSGLLLQHRRFSAEHVVHEVGWEHMTSISPVLT